MSLLDIDDKKLGQNVVLHFTHLPGEGEAGRLAVGEGYQDSAYEQRKGKLRISSRFLQRGYEALLPVCDAEVVRNRQSVVRYFLTDFPEKTRYFPMLNMMHLIKEWSSNLDRETGLYEKRFMNPFKSGEGAKVLERYLSETRELQAEFAKVGGFLARLSEEYEARVPKELIEKMIEVCKRGAFDNLVLKREGLSFNVHGIIKQYRPREEGSVELGTQDLCEQMGWAPEDFVKYGFFLARDALDSFYAPLAALYQEAAYMHKRKAGDKRVCLPKINNAGIFEMIEGEPILRTPEPVEWRSFRFDNESSRALLNGLHSGGKTHLLCDIPLYIIRGLSGFPLPACSAKIPLTRRIFHSFVIEKQDVGGSLESEMKRRAEEIREARQGDLFLIDEFLQHASPDAAEPLEPIILDEYAKTRATFIIVDHRGDTADEAKWKFWSPGFKEGERGEIMPTYKFARGRPSQEILRRHASQLVRKLAEERTEEKKRSEHEPLYFDREEQELLWTWLDRIKQRILSGDY